MKDNKHTYIVIMAGGIGSRFWPVSRKNHPKQFLDILGTGKTLIQDTMARFASFVPKENIYVITAKEYEEITKEQLSDLPAENIIGEPYRKNTAPCIAYISFHIIKKDPQASVIVAPADHLILDKENFLSICSKALEFVNNHDALVTLGIQPTYPNTGYGYIQFNAAEAAPSVHKVKTFTEKPNKELAQTFIASGDFLWNSGIFFWRVDSILKALHKHLPEIYEVFAAEKDKFNTEEEKATLEAIYPLCTSISIDFGVMEKAHNVYVIPSSFGWSDLGTWNSAWENMEKDYLDNAVAGDKVMVIDATRCVVHAPKNKLVVLQGLDDYIVVDTKDVLLICKKEKEQEIKEYTADVKRNMGEKYL